MANEGQPEALALVRHEEDEEQSPSKKARQELPITQLDLVSTIQAAVASSVATHLAPFTASLQLIQQGQYAANQRLASVEVKQEQTTRELSELNDAHSRRMDELQAEIVELQKADFSKPTCPTSPETSRAYRVVPPADQESLDLVIGGWVEGKSRDAVLSLIQNAVSQSGMGERVVETEPRGKRPTMCKLVLSFRAGLSNSEKRKEQLEIRDAIRACLQAPVWCKTDQPLDIRAVGKAIAMLSGFLVEKLTMRREDLEVGSWSQARAFIGEHRVTRMLSAFAPNSHVRQDERMIVRDAKAGVSVAVDLAALATAAKRTPQDVAVLEDAEVDNHVIALQEVTASKESGIACGSEAQTPECDMVGDMLVLSGLPEGCFRRLVFCVEDGISWSSFQIGYAHICMRFQATGRDVLFVNVHLPHSGRPVNDFLLACESIVATVQPSSDKGIPIVLLGDLNYDLFRDDPASDRGAAVHAMLSVLGLTVWPSNRGYTWRRRTIDYVICNDAFGRMSACHSSAHRPWGEYAVRPDLREMLRVDHNAVVCDVLLPRPAGPAPGRRRRRVDWSRVPRRMCVVDPDAMAAQVDALPQALEGASSGVPWLNRLAATLTKPRRALRYLDPPEVKELCHVRSRTVDLEVRRRLSLQIVEACKLAKQAWKRQLYLSAASGNWQARRRLAKTVSLEASLWPMLLQLDGDRSKLVEEVKTHFMNKFSPELHCGDVLRRLAQLPDVEPPFTAPEILECLRTMKMNQTTGMSKVSVELLRALTAHEVGLASLRRILNDMLTWPELLVQCDLLVGWVILLPKKPQVSSADMLRPIVLGEVVVKSLCGSKSLVQDHKVSKPGSITM
ncbi:unnamed protein product [Symbiodinium sp. CCMP2592]|nr:unnamed protein product [Symbiodinium sp. CCMP2592]